MKLALLAALLVMAAAPACGSGRVVTQAAAPHVAAPAEDELPRKAAYFGVRIAAIPDDVQARYGLRDGEGVRIETVVPGTAAALDGVIVGDIVLTMDGGVVGLSDFLETVPRLRSGQGIVLGLLRDGERHTVTVTIRERPRDRGTNFDVLYGHVRSSGARIRTIVTRPREAGPHPALVLVQALGASSIDEPLAAATPYSRILSAFADSGYVTVRIEKPGIGDSEGGRYDDIDFVTELDVYRQALAAVAKMEFVDRDQVFVFGHAIGGVFAPLLATEIPVRGVAVYGTLVKRGSEYVRESTRRQAMLVGGTPTSIEPTLRALDVILREVLVEGRTLTEVAQRRPRVRPVLGRMFWDGRLYGRSLRFWAQLEHTDLEGAWTKASGHALVMWGRHDFIATEDDHVRIATIVEKARPGKATYLAIDEADHSFRKTVSVKDSFQRFFPGSPGGEISSAVVTALKMWTEKVRHGR
jgi:pimeloyl-ACP methyl ester carboxylesterase